MADKNPFAPADTGTGNENPFAPPPPERSAIKDLALSLGKGVVGVGESAVGIADAYTGGAAGNALQDLGYDPKATRQIIDAQMSPAAQADAAAVSNAKGFVDTAKEVITRPGYIANTIAESAPSMAAGLAVGKGVQKIAPGTSAAAAGAIGEGVVSAGQTAEQIRQDTGTLDNKGTVAALGSGAAVALTGAIGNVAARTLKAASPDTMGLARKANETIEGNVIGRIGKGAVVESAEEVIQSAFEQVGQNYGTGKPLMEGVPEQAAIGGVVGGVMGAGANVRPGTHRNADATPEQEQNQPEVPKPAGPLSVAANVAAKSGAVQSGEQQPTAPPQGMGGNRGLIYEAATRNGVDPRTALVISSIETGGRFNHDAQNPRSSANGMFQFMDATRKMFPEVTPEQWRDPAVQAEYGAKFIARTNAAMQQTLGRAPTTGEAYMGHLLGAHGATSLLTADPNMSARDVIAQWSPNRADEIVRLNGMKGLTAGEAVAKWNGIAEQHAQRLGVEETAFPFSDKAAAEMRVRAAAQEGQTLEVVDHPTVPGRFAALPALAGDPNEAQPASKVPLVADLPRADADPNAPQTTEAVPQQTGLQVAAPAGGQLAVPEQQPLAVQPATAAAPEVATAGGSAAASVTDPAEQEALRQELIAQRGLTPGVDYNANPTPAQAAAGNYKKVHENFEGLPLTLENPIGSTRRGTNEDGTPWETHMTMADYGYVKRTVGADTNPFGGKPEQVDVYVAKERTPDAKVYVFDQHGIDADGVSTGFDEHKAVLGASSLEHAQSIYDSGFSDQSGPLRRADVTEMSMPEFKAWLKDGSSTQSMSAAEAAPQIREQQAVKDGILPPAEEFAAEPAAVPVAAKFTADIQRAVSAPQQLDEADTAEFTGLNAALEHAGFAAVAPLRSAPAPEAALVAAVAERAFGKRVIHVEPAEGFNGVAFKDRIYLAANETNPAAFTIGHEVAHTVEGRKVHSVLTEVFRTFAHNADQQVAERQQFEQASDGRAITRKYAQNELVADMNGSMWVQPEFWKELAARDESVFRRVAYKFMELGTKALSVVRGTNVDASSIVRDVQGARSAIAQAWADHLNTKRSAKRDGTTGQQVLFDKSRGLPPDPIMGAQRDENLRQFLDGSVVQEPMFHGTARDITRFTPKQAQAIFLAPKPAISEDFAQASENWMAKNYLRELPAEKIEAAKDAALADIEEAWNKGDLNDEAIDMAEAIAGDRAEENGMAWDYLEPRLREQMPTRQNLMPLHVRATKPFDYQNPEHVSALVRKMGADLTTEGRIKQGAWDVIESPKAIEAMKALGHDSFYVTEGGTKNLAVFSSNQLKSVTGNFGTFNKEAGDIRFSKVKEVELPHKLLSSLTVPEKAKLRRDVAERLVKLFDQLPSAQEMAAIAWSGKAARGWYADSARAISHVFGPDAPRFTALLAALSPQNSVQMNLHNAARIWAGWVKAGRPTERDAIIKVMGDNVVGNKLTDSVLDAWVNNSVRALADPDPSKTVLSGPKVNSFMQNLRGNVEEVTNDAWMAAFAAVDQSIFGGKLTKGGNPGKGSGYLAMSARVREAAQTLSSLTGDAWSPAEVQETVWAWSKTLYEMQEDREGGYGAREIIDNGELRDELIAATPEFSSLLLDDKYGQSLRSAGYGQRIDDLRSLPGLGRNATVSRAEGKAGPFAERTQQRHERNAADRLERLRDERARGEAATRAEARGLRNKGGVRGGDGGLAFSRRQDQGDGRARPLEGLPATVQVDGKPVTFGPYQPAHDAARAYMEKAGLPYNPPTKYAKVDRARAERIAQAFEEMKHDPQNPVVKQAYAQMIRETVAQYEAALAQGLKVEFIDFEKQGDPYGNPRNAILDVVNNNHMWVFSTRDGFGSSDTFDPVDNPLLAETGYTISGKPALANDLFRVVHDYFGHIKDGVGFRADGEENAWRSHSAMYSPLARMAMTTETRGQNSWLNFGPYGEANRTANTADTHFADQKIGVLPQFAIDEGRADAPDEPAPEIALSKTPAALKSVAVPEIKSRIKGKWTDLRKFHLAGLGGRQIAEVYGRDLPQLPQYQKLVQMMQAGVNDYAAKADKVASDWGKVKDDRQLAELMHDATLGHIDPAKDYVQGDSESLYRELRARWDKLSPQAQAIYKQARDMYETHYAEVRQAIRDRIERAEGLSTPKKSEMLKRMDGEFFERVQGVYFPLARFGDYVVVVRDAEGKVASVSRAETKHEADTLRRELKSQFGLGYKVGAVMKSAEFNARRDAVGTQFLESLFKVLDETGIGEDLQDDINQLVLSSMPDLSWAKHGIHRKGTAGFSQDARRAFAQNMFHGARYLQRVRFGDRLEGKLREAEKYVKGRAELTESVKEQQVLDEVRKRHELLMNPQTAQWSNVLTSFGFFFHLGLSPASALVNLTQTPLVAYPLLAGKWGFGRAASALTKASADVLAAKNDLVKHLKGDEKAAIQRAIDEGTIDVTMAHDLAGIAQGQDEGVMWKVRPVMRAASFMFHHAERFNRQATFLAAYRMAKERGQSSDEAFNTASDLTFASHFDYASSNRPRAMQGNAAKVVLQFKQYSQNMTFLLANNLREALAGDKQAMKTLGGLIVMAGAAAGAVGVPLVAQLLSLASMVGGSDDEPWDATVALQNYLADTFGQKVAEVLMHGVSRLGPADISGRVSLDLHKMWFPDVNEALEGQKAYESFLAGMAGPVVGGIGGNLFKGFDLISDGKWAEAMEALAPSVLRGPLKAQRYAEDGAKTKDGMVIKDDVSAPGLASQALGFRPSEVANAQEGRSAIINADRRLGQRRQELLDSFAKAAMKGEDTSDAMSAIQSWNEANPNRFIGGMHLQASIATRAKRIAQAEQGVYLPANKRDVIQEGRFAVTE